jgi:hypothetical protein
MRPVGEVTQALLHATAVLASPNHGGSMREIISQACVGRAVGAYMIASLKRRGRLEIVALRTVSYRSRPVAEYALPVTGGACLPGAASQLLQHAWRDL